LILTRIVVYSVPGELNVYTGPEILQYSQKGFFGPERHIWFNFTIRDNDTIGNLQQIKVVAYHRQYSSLSDSDSREYHYTFTWTWSEGWKEETYTEHLGYNSSPTDSTAITGDWELEIICDTKCVPGLWDIYLEVVDQQQGRDTLTVNIEGYGPYEVVIENVLATADTQVTVKAYIEVTNYNSRYAPDVTLVTQIYDTVNNLLTEKNTTINVPTEYSKLVEVKLTFTDQAGEQYILTAYVVDPHQIPSTEARYVFEVTAAVIPPPYIPSPPTPPPVAPVPVPSWFWTFVAVIILIIIIIIVVFILIRMSKGKPISISETWS